MNMNLRDFHDRYIGIAENIDFTVGGITPLFSVPSGRFAFISRLVFFAEDISGIIARPRGTIGDNVPLYDNLIFDWTGPYIFCSNLTGGGQIERFKVDKCLV